MNPTYTTLGDRQIYIIGFLIAAVFIGAIIAVILKVNSRSKASMRRAGDPARMAHKIDAGDNIDHEQSDLTGGRDVSAALGVQQSTGIKIAKGPRAEDVKRDTREMY